MAVSRTDLNKVQTWRQAGFRMIRFEEPMAEWVVKWVASLEDLRWVAPCTAPPLTAEKVLDWHRHSVSPYIFIDSDGIPVGYGELVPSQSHPEEVWIAHLVVQPERRNTGVGKAFVRALLDKSFEELGAEIVSLSVFEDNYAGRSCYSRCGFRECGGRTLRPIWLTDDQPLVDMRVERFDWLARRWKETLREATSGADWAAYYRDYRKGRYRGDLNLKRRFQRILESAPVGTGQAFIAADFGSGSGILAEAIANSFPQASVWAFDADPLQVLMGEEALKDEYDGRIQFELADLRQPAWAFGRHEMFALAASALSLHWMGRDSLRRFYFSLYPTIAPDGVFANSDHIAIDPGWGQSLFNLTSRSQTARTLFPAKKPVQCFPWTEWWRHLKADLGIEYLCEQMAAELVVYEGLEQGQPLRFHQTSLRNAGFSEVREVWRDGGDAVIVAMK